MPNIKKVLKVSYSILVDKISEVSSILHLECVDCTITYYTIGHIVVHFSQLHLLIAF